MDDRALNAALPPEARSFAESAWTKVAVAERAAHHFVDRGCKRVLDVGAGCGKFCIAAAAAHPELELVGCEQNPRLVEIANELARSFAVTNVQFVVGDATRIEWSPFDGIYLFRPFDDEDVHFIRRIEHAMDTARIGTVVVTFNRFGGRIPTGFDLASEERVDWNWLRVWVKVRPQTITDGFWLEHASGASRVTPE